MFVANRVQEIQENTSIDQWKYVESKQNPADEASQGLKTLELLNSQWMDHWTKVSLGERKPVDIQR